MKSSLIVPLLAANLAVASAVHAGTAAIWKLSDDNSTVYLAGSVHLLRERDMPYPKAYDTAYEDSEELVFEIDMKEMNAPDAAIKMRQMGTLPTGKTLGDHLSQEMLAALDGYLKANNLPAGMFNQLTPGMVYLTLGSMEALRQGARPDLGIEMQFHKKAEKDGKPGSGLETTAYQMSRFNELDVETLNDLIKETIEASNQNEDTLNSIIEAWKSGDAESLQKLVHDEMAERPAVLEILLVERNQNWIPVIEEKLAGDKNVMFIVGAAHLVGEGSVVQLLEDKGHKLVQLGTDK